MLPLMVRDVFGGGSAELALVNTCFWGGTIASTIFQIRRSALRRPGPLSVFALICLVWGVGAGVVLTQGRIIVQLETPESHRARALAVFQLGFTGGSPIGALCMGYLAGQVGPRSAVLYPAAAMAVVLVVLFRRSGLWGHTGTSALSTPARS